MARTWSALSARVLELADSWSLAEYASPWAVEALIAITESGPSLDGAVDRTFFHALLLAQLVGHRSELGKAGTELGLSQRLRI